MSEFAAIVLAYLIGSIPTGFILTRLIVGQDLRTVGSGGTGATNARRALGSRWGAVVALIDVAKGILAVIVARGLTDDALVIAIAGAVVVVGHCWPVWLGFQGGKGVATGGGAAMALSLWCLLLIPIIIIPVVVTRYVSLGSLTAAASAPIIFGILAMTDQTPTEYLIFAVVAAATIIWRHRENIGRLRGGTERRLARQAGTTGGA
jgi:glycerol-3-phosphate acyltransferase PlsY